MRVLVLFSAVLLLTGCQYFKWDAEPKDIHLNSGERKPAPKIVNLIGEPRLVREDITYPGNTKQSFYWRENYSEWRFNFPRQGYAYAGFRFRIPLNLSRELDSYILSFTIKPKSKSEHLWVALVDGDDTKPNTLVELPIKPYIHSFLRRKGYRISIPINEFPARGVPVKGENGTVTTDTSPFDWKDVRQIRIIKSGGFMPSGDIVVTKITIER